MARVVALLAVLGLAIPLSGCVVDGPGYGHGGGNWCYWHPERCRR